jgi:hypothetical protein
MTILIEHAESGLCDDLSKEEKTAELNKKVHAKLHELGSTVALKLQPLLKAMTEHLANQQTEAELAVIELPSLSLAKKTEIYKRLFFNTFENSEVTAFKVSNKSALGNLDPKHYFYLLLFSMATCQRSRSDGLLQLYLSGASSVGKSTLVEDVLSSSAHQLVSSSNASSAGCGRFNLKSRNILMLRDAVLSNIFGADLNAVKMACRGEAFSAKTHGSTELVSAAFVLISSNERLNKFSFPTKTFLMDIYESHLNQPGTKKIREEHADAIRARFLEVFVRKRCVQKIEDLREANGFRKIHLIAALYDTAQQLLSSYKPEDFASKHFYLYVLFGLAKNVEIYCKTFGADQASLEKLLEVLRNKYGLYTAPKFKVPLSLATVKIEQCENK